MPTSSKAAATVFSVTPDASLNSATVQQTGAISLDTKYSVLMTAQVGPKTYLFAYSPSLAAADVFECSAVAPFLTPAKTKLAIGEAKDMLNVFTLGNQTYLSVYTAKNGVFQIYAVNADLSLSKSYEFYRNHELALSQNFSTLAFFTQFGQIVALGYRQDTGYVATYTVATVATSTGGVPPLLMAPVWSHMWAPGWTRFAFFQLGGEPFFLKTNVKKLNVNIDHVLDTLSAGTTEVGTLLQNQLPDALKLTNVALLLLNAADPWFVTYIASTGAATLNRIHSDCLGWTQGASFKAPTGSATVTPVVVGGKTFLIFI
jgi:hypothetical protein